MQPSISLIGEGSGTGGTSTSSVTINFPAGYQVGDEIYVATTQSSTTTVSAPSTYTLVTSVASGGTSPLAGTDVYEHTIASGETSVTISYSGTSSVKSVVLADYRGVDTTLPVDVYSSASTAGGTTVVAPSVSPAYANDRLVVFQGARGTFSSKSWTAPTGMTEQVQVNSQANVSAGLADLALTSAGATGSKTSTFSASANLTTIILAIPQLPSVLFYQTDQLGSIRMLTDSAGVVRGTFSYDAYGNLIGNTGSFSTPLGWCGQYRDAESGLTYLQARYYDPVTGQFLSRDPMVATSGSPYDYVADNPLNGTDPTGRYEYNFSFGLGYWGACGAQIAAGIFESDPSSVFPFEISGPNGESYLEVGSTYVLRAANGNRIGPIKVTQMSGTSVSFVSTFAVRAAS